MRGRRRATSDDDVYSAHTAADFRQVPKLASQRAPRCGLTRGTTAEPPRAARHGAMRGGRPCKAEYAPLQIFWLEGARARRKNCAVA